MAEDKPKIDASLRLAEAEKADQEIARKLTLELIGKTGSESEAIALSAIQKAKTPLERAIQRRNMALDDLNELLRVKVAALAEAEKKRDHWHALVVDSCEEDREIRDLVRSLLGDVKTDGDNYGVPGVVDIVLELIELHESLFEQLAEAEKLNTELTNDINAAVLRNEALQEREVELVAACKAKDDFLMTACHENVNCHSGQGCVCGLAKALALQPDSSALEAVMKPALDALRMIRTDWFGDDRETVRICDEALAHYPPVLEKNQEKP